MLSAVIQVIYFSLILLELNAIAFTKVRFESIYSMYPKKLLLGDKNYSKFVGITFPLKNYVPSHCIICQLLSKQKRIEALLYERYVMMVKMVCSGTSHCSCSLFVSTFLNVSVIKQHLQKTYFT